jgi:hypothetical protein
MSGGRGPAGRANERSSAVIKSIPKFALPDKTMQDIFIEDLASYILGWLDVHTIAKFVLCLSVFLEYKKLFHSEISPINAL